jgi:hypothetical protein
MINPIHVSGTPENDAVMYIDVRMYFSRDEDREEMLDEINAALGQSPSMISAYEMLSDGFGHLVPDDKPIA